MPLKAGWNDNLGWRINLDEEYSSWKDHHGWRITMDEGSPWMKDHHEWKITMLEGSPWMKDHFAERITVDERSPWLNNYHLARKITRAIFSHEPQSWPPINHSLGLGNNMREEKWKTIYPKMGKGNFKKMFLWVLSKEWSTMIDYHRALFFAEH